MLSSAYQALDEKIQCDVIYTDFTKAFDTVSHDFLMYKIRKYGISGNLYNWIQSYLTDRQQRVVFNGSFSSWQPVTSGVPQGSVLGPLFFNMFVDDIPSIYDYSQCLLFADDLKLFRMVRGPDDAQLLQEDLDKLSTWSSSWKLTLNPSKCKVLTLTLKKQPVLHTYELAQTQLERVTNHKDLGIFVDSKLTFTPHIDYIVAKANRMLGIFLASLYKSGSKNKTSALLFPCKAQS